MSHVLLDAPEPPAPRRTSTIQKIFVGIELLLWSVALVGLFLKLESWEYGYELLILAFSSLSFLYFLGAIPLFGSRGWKQHLGGHVVGFVLMISLLARLFVLESWPGGREMIIISVPLAAILLLTTGVLWLVRRQRPEGGDFYRNAAIRLGILFVPVLFALN